MLETPSIRNSEDDSLVIDHSCFVCAVECSFHCSITIVITTFIVEIETIGDEERVDREMFFGVVEQHSLTFTSSISTQFRVKLVVG